MYPKKLVPGSNRFYRGHFQNIPNIKRFFDHAANVSCCEKETGKVSFLLLTFRTDINNGGKDNSIMIVFNCTELRVFDKRKAVIILSIFVENTVFSWGFSPHVNPNFRPVPRSRDTRNIRWMVQPEFRLSQSEFNSVQKRKHSRSRSIAIISSKFWISLHVYQHVSFSAAFRILQVTVLKRQRQNIKI